MSDLGFCGTDIPPVIDCAKCSGTGWAWRVLWGSQRLRQPCSRCHGTGRVLTHLLCTGRAESSTLRLIPPVCQPQSHAAEEIEAA